MTALQHDNSIAAMALQFTILTAARTNEVRLAPWSEIDIKHRIWRIPASRMKADRPHRVPLSDAAVEILTALKGNSKPGKRDYIFAEPNGRPLSEKALRRACHRINPAISVHGMRSTFRDWVGDNTKFPRELAELALAHAIKGSAEAAYWRDDALERRRPMMEAWGRFCIPAKAAKVIPFAAA
jgi:integrase